MIIQVDEARKRKLVGGDNDAWTSLYKELYIHCLRGLIFGDEGLRRMQGHDLDPLLNITYTELYLRRSNLDWTDICTYSKKTLKSRAVDAYRNNTRKNPKAGEDGKQKKRIPKYAVESDIAGPTGGSPLDRIQSALPSGSKESSVADERKKLLDKAMDIMWDKNPKYYEALKSRIDGQSRREVAVKQLEQERSATDGPPSEAEIREQMNKVSNTRSKALRRLKTILGVD